jgi:hypothetical protein
MGLMDNFKDLMGKVQKASEDLQKQTGDWAKKNDVEGKAKTVLNAFLQQAAKNAGINLPTGAPKPAPAPQPAAKPKKTPFPPRNFNPGENAFQIQYHNHAGEDKVFTGDKRSVAETQNHYSVRVAPTGKRIYLLKKSVKNADELKKLAGPTPHGKDRQILSYHLRHRSTSPKFEEAKKKFYSWL